MEYKILEKIESPNDLKKLDDLQLKLLCDEMRDCIINTVSKNGGHLASNLGTVELTVAIHRAFNAPEDSIIFDVGHQSYSHKLLTGRYKDFASIRKENGISGFMRPDESEYDPFVTGHSSNSISAAYGIYKSKCIKNEPGMSVAVIGDGAMTGGMAYEAMNNVAASRNKFIIILNDNKMSISRNVGAVSRALTKMRNKPKYHYFKFALAKFLNKIPFIGTKLEKLLTKTKEFAKRAVYKNNIFSDMGFNYLGPVNGHDIKSLEELLKVAQQYSRPTLVHVITQKGKGYQFAEDQPGNYHGVSPFDVNKGLADYSVETFSSVAGKALCDLAEEDETVCAITAAMREGTGLSEFSQKFKNRFFDVGIAEQHAVTFSAGLAIKGLKPYFAVYSSFFQRAYDQIIHDCAIANIPVRFLVDRAGIVGEDGETHQGVFDVAFLSSIPNMNIYSPCCGNELKQVICESLKRNDLCAIRYPRGKDTALQIDSFSGEYTVFDGAENICVVTYGREFCEVYYSYSKSKNFTVIKLNKIYPISDELIKNLLSFDKIYTFEEVVKSGSISEHIALLLLAKNYKGEFFPNTLPDEFIPSSKVFECIKKYGLDTESIDKILK